MDLSEQDVDEIMGALETARGGFVYSALAEMKYVKSGEKQKSELAKMVLEELATAYRNSADIIFSDNTEVQERYDEQLNDPNIQGIEKTMKEYALNMGSVVKTHD